MFEKNNRKAFLVSGLTFFLAATFVILAGFTVSAFIFLMSPKPQGSAPISIVASSTNPLSSSFSGARFFPFDSSNGGMALGEDAYLYSQYGAPILKYLGHFQPGLNMRLENGRYGNVVVVETPDETKTYFDWETGNRLATFRSYDFNDGTTQGFFIERIFLMTEGPSTVPIYKDLSIKLVSSCDKNPGSEGELTAIKLFPFDKVIPIPELDRVAVRCIQGAGTEGIKYASVPNGPTPYAYRGPDVDPETEQLHIPIGLSSLTISLPQNTTSTYDVKLEPTRMIAPAHGGYTLRAPISVPICQDSEGGLSCQTYTDGDWSEPAATEYAGGFEGLNPSSPSLPERPSFSIRFTKNTLSESVVSFGKKLLASGRASGATYTDEQETQVDGETAFSFMATNALTEVGGKDSPIVEIRGVPLRNTAKIFYFVHNGHFFEVLFPANDDLSERIMRTWKWQP